jgi:hypothetical protein
MMDCYRTRRSDATFARSSIARHACPRAHVTSASNPLGIRLASSAWARRPRRGRRNRALAEKQQETSNRGGPRVVVPPEIDDGATRARRTRDAHAPPQRRVTSWSGMRSTANRRAGAQNAGLEFRKPPRRLLYMWPRKKACQHIRDRVREVVRSFPSSASIGEVIRKLNPILNGWCTYFRVGNSNRIFHLIDRAVQSELHLWLRRKHQCSWRSARKRWNYQFLYKRCRLYQMVGRVSHLPGLRRMPPEEDGRRAGCGKTARPVR